jgi:hypothetical protein
MSQPYLPISVEEIAAITTVDHWTNRRVTYCLPSTRKVKGEYQYTVVHCSVISSLDTDSVGDEMLRFSFTF